GFHGALEFPRHERDPLSQGEYQGNDDGVYEQRGDERICHAKSGKAYNRLEPGGRHGRQKYTQAFVGSQRTFVQRFAVTKVSPCSLAFATFCILYPRSMTPG